MGRPIRFDWTGVSVGFRVISRLPSHDSQSRWQCLCLCGKEFVATGASLLRGKTRSCGCYRKIWATIAKKTHGYRHLPEYPIWNAMKQRCYNPNQSHYERYGGRGITVCDEWRKSFAAFYRDMGPRPIGPTGKRYSIERKDNDGPYAKWNCHWATYYEQARNKRSRK